MAFDIIVYGQDELENALETGYTSVALCDNSFILPLKGGMCYMAIGNITAEINIDEESFNELGICCVGFIPVFIGGNTSQMQEVIQPELCNSSFSSYISSYIMSSYSGFVTSYLYKHTGSFITSYVYEYEYEYAGSFTSSYTTSFISSYSASFSLNMLLSEEIWGTKQSEECIWVNGYGINLI